MYTVIRSIIKPQEDLHHTILKSSITCPEIGTATNITAVYIAGWVLLGNGKEPKVTVEGHDINQIFPCYVQKNNTSKESSGEAGYNTKYNFRIRWIQTGFFKVYFVVDNEKILVAELEILAQDNVLGAIQTWNKFIYNRTHEFSIFEAKELQLLSENLIKQYIYKRPEISVGKIELADNHSGFSHEEKRFLKSFFLKVMSGEFCADLIESVLDNAFCSITNPFGSGFARCNESFHVLGATVLRFITPNNETFFIIQNPTSADAIYFPSREFIFCTRVNRAEYVHQIIIKLCHNFTKVLNYILKSSNNKFAGVIASHNRPYHFYYDICLGLYFLKIRNLIHKLPDIYIQKGCYFFSIQELFDTKSCKYIKSPIELQQKSQDDGLFFINVGANGLDIRNKSYIENLDEIILSKSYQLIDPDTTNELENAKKCYPLLWFGVTAQKRSWVEQVEACAKVINELVKSYPNIGVVFDGWTSPISTTRQDVNEIAKDESVVKQIMQLLPKQVSIFSVVGASTVRKLAFATAIDMFIVNNATGSINVDRFAKKMGIGHTSNRLRKSSNTAHIHYQTTIVPSEKVTDIPNPDAIRPGFISYSIDPDVILDMAKEILEKRDISQSITG